MASGTRDKGRVRGAGGGSSVGVVLIGHGQTASALLAAARLIAPSSTLEDLRAIDAGAGRNEQFTRRLCAAVDDVDQDKGVLIIADMFGSSPCTCGMDQASTHDVVIVAGLNLAMLLKLGGCDRQTATLQEISEACADTGRRAVVIRIPTKADCT